MKEDITKIKRIVNGSRIPNEDKDDVADYFTELWYRYYEKDEDVNLIDMTAGVQKFWKWLTVTLLLGRLQRGEKKAKTLLCKELHADFVQYAFPPKKEKKDDKEAA